VHVWSTLGELARQVLEGSFGDDDEVWAGDAEVMFEVGEEGDGSKGLAETISSARMLFRPVMVYETI